MDEIVYHNGIEYRHVPAENPGFCGSCDYLDVHGDACPKGSAPCRHDTILRATTPEADQLYKGGICNFCVAEKEG